MNIFKRKKEMKMPELKTSEKESTSNLNLDSFSNTIRVQNYDEKIRLLKLKEDFIQGKTEVRDLTTKELDKVARLLEEDIAQNDIKLKGLQRQIEQYNKNN